MRKGRGLSFVCIYFVTLYMYVSVFCVCVCIWGGVSTYKHFAFRDLHWSHWKTKKKNLCIENLEYFFLKISLSRAFTIIWKKSLFIHFKPILRFMIFSSSIAKAVQLLHYSALKSVNIIVIQLTCITTVYYCNWHLFI